MLEAEGDVDSDFLIQKHGQSSLAFGEHLVPGAATASLCSPQPSTSRPLPQHHGSPLTLVGETIISDLSKGYFYPDKCDDSEKVSYFSTNRPFKFIVQRQLYQWFLIH